MRTKSFTVVGYQYVADKGTIIPTKFNCLLTENGSIRTLSVDNDRVQYTFNLQEVINHAEESEEEE